MKKLYLSVLIVLLIAAAFAGCAGSEPDYAEPIVENILASIDSGDYEAFSRDLGDTLKSAMTEDAFNSLKDLLDSKAGRYQQKSFRDAAQTTQNGIKMTVAVYTAKYSDEPGDVIVTVTFAGDEQKKVEGLFFNSPKLREQ